MAGRLFMCGPETRLNPTTATIKLTGRFSSVLLLTIDNSLNNAPIQREFEIKSSCTVSYDQLIKSIQKNNKGTAFDAYAAMKVFEIIDIGFNGDDNLIIAKTWHEALLGKKPENSQEFTRKDTYTVGPYSKLTLYGRQFTAPGISYRTDLISNQEIPPCPVEIDITLGTRAFLKYIEIIYSDESLRRPPHIIPMAKGHDQDINAGFGGECVWLIPRWTENIHEAATGISIVYQKKENSKFKNLIKGTEGLYRYILIENEPYVKGKLITEVALYRTSKNLQEDDPKSKWEFASDNINKDRDKDFLYLVWNMSDVEV